MVFRYMGIKNYRADPRWRPSIGEKLDKTHFRNGHWHAECDPTTDRCSTHYDEHNPYESPSELAKHIWKSDLGKAVVIGGAALALIAVLKSR